MGDVNSVGRIPRLLMCYGELLDLLFLEGSRNAADLIRLHFVG